MIVIDEYLALRVLGGDWPEGLPDDDDVALPASRHWRLLQRVHAPSGGQLSQRLAALPERDLEVVSRPHPEVLQILDPRPLLDEAAALAARYGGGLLVAETLVAGLLHPGRSGSEPMPMSAASSPEQPTTWALPSTSSAEADPGLFAPVR